MIMLSSRISPCRDAVIVAMFYRMNHYYINPYGRVEFESLTGSNTEPTK